ncbi:cation:proton antiporter [Limosilactobacillus fermentum]|uniref:cation:proton antiporter n=1 Tax=Limosilactobacillus fermentum TaxID=1613 RepID=UPI00062D2EDD|nr:cation:proton antiporter [Limosilactobacillus fermentum]AZI17822.1 cation:proton antiporter [Limosilactobacillus fermentum]KLD56368.1 sodium:proton antiporter [Limosilactobacillus fermentum]MBM9559958.1 cation:proton antiporter [Limosilactobacillus fermentum]MCT3429299.1 cation:proton antiporter [Limosilactobacillus fermentum]MDC6079774.1 cation:proton antiporter [Limosilactobacillus fermentum]
MSFIITLTGILFVTQLVSHFFNRWGIPDVIGQILVGIVAGPAVLGWIHQTAMIEEFQEIGVIVLMFIAGLESDLSLLKKYLKPAMAVAVGGMALPIVVMGLASQLFGLQWFESLFIGVIFSATSVSISVAVLREFNQINSKEGATVLGAAVADDIGGVLILSVLISLMNGKGGESSTSLPLIIMMQAIFFGGTYLLVRWLAPYLMHLSKRLLTTAAPAVMAMILCLGMASLADLVHLSGAVGAFFAGIAVANTKARHDIAEAFEPLGYAVFIPVFFVNVGLVMRLNHFFDSLVFIVVMTILACLTKLIGSGGGAMLMGFDRQSGYVIGSGMIARGEMALITAQIGYEAHLLSSKYYSDVITVVVLATVLAPFILKHALKRLHHPVTY